MIAQIDIDRPLMGPQGCLLMDLWRSPFEFARVDWDVRTVERIYDDCLMGKGWNFKPIIETITQFGRKLLAINDPTRALQMAASYIGGVTGRQYPDLLCQWPKEKPRDYALQYTAVQFNRPNDLEHYTLCDAAGINVLFDSAPGKIDGWDRTGTWRGIQVWRV